MSDDLTKLIYGKVNEFIGDMKKENLSAYAAGAAFFIFLSIVPILILACAIIPYTPLTKANLIGLFLEIIPDRMEGLVTAIVEDVYHRSAGVLSAAILITLWSAGKGILAVIRGLNAINDVEEQRNYFVIRIVSSFYTMLMILMIFISMTLLVFGNTLVNLLNVQFPQLKILFSVLINFRFLMIWFILMGIFATFYTYLPDRKLRFNEQLPGAAFASVIWSIFSWGFAMYIDSGNSFRVYGSLTVIVIFMLWLYFCIYIMFIGAYINKYITEKEETKYI